MRVRLRRPPGTLFKRRTRTAGIAASWAYLFVARGDAPLVIAGRPISEREKLLGASAVSVAVIFFLTSVGSVLFSAVCIGLAGACAARRALVELRLKASRRCRGVCRYALSSDSADLQCDSRAGVATHGALRVPDDLFLDDVSDSSSFFPSLLPSSGSGPRPLV